MHTVEEPLFMSVFLAWRRLLVSARIRAGKYRRPSPRLVD